MCSTSDACHDLSLDRRRLRAAPGPAASVARQGFTLVEILVVVAVIALLSSILLPSLKQARDQAKLAVCMSNCKQVANMTGAYQADYRGLVPVVLSWRANRFFGTPPRATWLSFALRHYDQKASRLPAEYNPDAAGTWTSAKRERYEAELLPEHFVCPFERPGPRQEVPLPGTDTEVTGRHEAIQTFGWEDIVRGYPIPPAKYSALTWNRLCAGGPAPMPDCISTPLDPAVLTSHRSWKSPDTRRLHGSLSELTTAFCYQGEHMEFIYTNGMRTRDRKQGLVDPRWNPGSHRTSRGGGSPAIFADGHVEWVPGPNIGWP
jgi:prepilin-type N-terminal cleavage/methylation domain-containing protein